MNKITWKDAVEFVGISAIVASLIAVTFELRQTQSALISATYQARAFDAIADHQYVAESEFLAPILARTNSGRDADAVASLNETDRLRLVRYLISKMVDLDNEFYQHQNGYLPNGFFEGTTIPGIKRLAPRWRSLGLDEGRQDFTDFVDSVLNEERPEANE